MNELTRILESVERGDPRAAAELLPLVYRELRELASQRLAREKPGQTLQATALVNEAYLRLVHGASAQTFNGRAHFFGAAAEAMRRILIENARRKARVRHGGERRRVDLDELSLNLTRDDAPSADDDDGAGEELLALDRALTSLEATDPQAAQLVKLRFFAGLTMPQAAESLGVSLRTAERNWTWARAWLHRALATA